MTVFDLQGHVNQRQAGIMLLIRKLTIAIADLPQFLVRHAYGYESEPV